MAKLKQTMDGNQAAAYASFALTEVAAIFPITPSTPMAELVDEWSSHDKKNIFNQSVRVVEMQSEAGAAGAVHGSLQGGALSCTYTASQGLLLMIPNMYKMVGERLPAVFHVSARAIAAEALSIFGDHQDVMATRQTGFAMLSSANVQEVMDMALIAHLSAIKSSHPFLHFFDGFRTSHEYQKIEVIDYEDMKRLVDTDAVMRFRQKGLNPDNPVIRGTAQNPDIYFQLRESKNNHVGEVVSIVEEYMKEIKKLTSRSYEPFEYYGDPTPDKVIIAMGSVSDTIDEVVDYCNASGQKVGRIKVRLYRPFSAEHLLRKIPKSVKKIAVLDRTKEVGSPGEPLFQDVVKVFYDQETQPIIVGGRYGLGSKDTQPAHILAVFKNLERKNPKSNFTIGIEDDVSKLSLPVEEWINTLPEGTVSCKFFGLGSDGTVGANKTAVQIIGDNTDLHVQAYFSYDSKKSGGSTISHLRFGKHPIRAPYLIYHADYIACHNPSFVHQIDLLKGIKINKTFVLNCSWTEEELEANLPAQTKRTLAKEEINFYTIDATNIALEIGLGGRINMIMQAAFFKLANIIPLEEAVNYMKASLQAMYGKKGQRVLDMNEKAIDEGIVRLKKIVIPSSWKNAKDDLDEEKDIPPFIKKVARVMARHEGDQLPVSSFLGVEDGTFPMGTTQYEKRGIAVLVPEWQIDKCIQCNHCALICPHAVIRPLLLTEEEIQGGPESFTAKKASGKGEIEAYQYRIQISPLDCTGCGNCADICPAPGKALYMKLASSQIAEQKDNWDYAMKLPIRNNIVNAKTLKGSQFSKPLLEFHGACPGCGETAYIKILTQLFGDRMTIANATGCSSIWGASSNSMAYCKDHLGRGPAWANSLFEDNAEFGYGLHLAVDQIRLRLFDLITQALTLDVSEELKNAMNDCLEHKEDGEASRRAGDRLVGLLEYSKKEALLQEIYDLRQYLVKRSEWIIGGDGWAYDIGYGGLDHVLALGSNVNLFVMDTEIYSNTGGQSSKSTPTAAIAKFASSGKKIRKKDLGLMVISYGYVYVAQIALGANYNQAIRAIIEAESYPGPSIIIAYAPCISHGIKTGMGTTVTQERKAVEAGYWHLYRYNPLLKEAGKNPFVLDSKEPKESLKEFLETEIRYSSLKKEFPDEANDLFEKAATHAKQRYLVYKMLSEANSI